ncbi:MAG TPA: hypothetical protein PKW98_09935, partial [Candidatus Wallbacteria bacterium]|nr:hypothetical protein [Candidatus Wallbacteria bacterium]
MNQYNRNAGGGYSNYNNSGGIESLKEEFINPYNYAENLGIDVRKPVRYHRETDGLISGRIKLRLTLESPTAIGGLLTDKPM